MKELTPFTFMDAKTKQRFSAGFVVEHGKARTFFHFDRAAGVQNLRKGERVYERPKS
jgi:hypothetical protein